MIQKIKSELPEVNIVSVPGPSALISALSISGLHTSEFLFLGFLPHKKGRETLFKEMSESKRTVVFYESPHRVMKTLDSLIKFAPEKYIVIAREITKIYEETIEGTPQEVKNFLENNKEKIRGEFVILVA